MFTRRIAAPALLLIAAAVAGCSHAPTESEAAAPAAAQVPAMDSTDGMVTLGERVRAHRRSLFSLTKNQYSYYVGGVMMARYHEDTGILQLSSLEPNQQEVVCEYNPAGELYVDAAAHSDGDGYASECGRLAQSLSADLAR